MALSNIPIIISHFMLDTITVPRDLTGFSALRAIVEDFFTGHSLPYPFKRVQRFDVKTIPSQKIMLIGGCQFWVCHPDTLLAIKDRFSETNYPDTREAYKQ